MSKPFVLYGWHLSYFSGKARSYLNYKGIPYREGSLNLYTLMLRNKRKTGVVVMPVLRTPEDEWLQDTSVIIDRLEQRFPAAPVLPESPLQRFLSYLFEAWGDEWWVPIAMHTRWSYPENYALWERDVGPALLPGFPAFAQRKAAAIPAKKLRGMLHSVGIRAEQFAVMNAWTLSMLDLLERHFASHPYLFGGRPTLADFSLIGTMYGHLGRDPWPARELVGPRPQLRAWIERMLNPPAGVQSAPLLADDQVAETLLPVIQAIFREFVPMLEGINQKVRALLPDYPAGKPLPRGLGDIEIPMGAGTFRRSALPYSLWMAQRVLDCLQALPTEQRESVEQWVRAQGGERLLELQLPRLQLAGLRVIANG